MEIILLGAVMLSCLFIAEKLYTQYQQRKRLETEQKGQLALEAQRFEKIKEILTDGVIDGSPKALDALKPLVEVMANQMSGDEITKQKKLDHEHRLAEIEVINEPYRLYAEQIKRAQDHDYKSAAGLQMEIEAVRKASEGMLLQRVSDSPLKSVPPDGPQFHLLEEGAVVKK